jgi:hypothetical protein
MRRLFAISGLAAAAGLAVATAAGADGTPLKGSVGPGFAISLKDASDVPVSQLAAGSYDLSVTDQSDEHNFHLNGPGVNVATEVAGTGTQTFPLTLVDGRYTFVCDAHPLTMKGAFNVGNAPAPTPTPPPPPSPTPKPTAPRLALTVTDKAISLKNAAGKLVRTLGAGAYQIRVSDRSKKQNAHVTGAGVNRKTGLAFVGVATWRVTLKAGTLTYRSDAKAPKLGPRKVPVTASA